MKTRCASKGPILVAYLTVLGCLAWSGEETIIEKGLLNMTSFDIFVRVTVPNPREAGIAPEEVADFMARKLRARLPGVKNSVATTLPTALNRPIMFIRVTAVWKQSSQGNDTLIYASCVHTQVTELFLLNPVRDGKAVSVRTPVIWWEWTTLAMGVGSIVDVKERIEMDLSEHARLFAEDFKRQNK